MDRACFTAATTSMWRSRGTRPLVYAPNARGEDHPPQSAWSQSCVPSQSQTPSSAQSQASSSPQHSPLRPRSDSHSMAIENTSERQASPVSSSAQLAPFWHRPASRTASSQSSLAPCRESVHSSVHSASVPTSSPHSSLFSQESLQTSSIDFFPHPMMERQRASDRA